MVPQDPARAEVRALWRRRMIAHDRVGIYRAVQGVVDRRGVCDALGRIRVPTLIVVGVQDAATVPAQAERMHAAIAGSRLVVVPGAGHASSIEEPEAVNAALTDFLSAQAGEVA